MKKEIAELYWMKGRVVWLKKGIQDEFALAGFDDEDYDIVQLYKDIMKKIDEAFTLKQRSKEE